MDNAAILKLERYFMHLKAIESCRKESKSSNSSIPDKITIDEL
jgi:hypothetical protein